MSDKKLIIEPRGGLGNRLLSISSAFNLAKECGISEIVMLWDNINECGCDYEDIFGAEPAGCKVKNLRFINESYKTMVMQGRIISVIKKALQRGSFKLYKIANIRNQFEADTIKTKEQQEELKRKVLAHKGKTVFIESYNQFYGDVDLSPVIFSEAITSKVDDYKKKLGTYDAMHIRRTDNVEAIKNSPTELFYEKIEELIREKADAKIYIATDDAAILDDLRKKYPEHIFSEATKSVSRRTTEGIQFAVYEMLILAGAKTLYASFFSTFSLIANCIGGNEMIVVKK